MRKARRTRKPENLTQPGGPSPHLSYGLHGLDYGSLNYVCLMDLYQASKPLNAN